MIRQRPFSLWCNVVAACTAIFITASSRAQSPVEFSAPIVQTGVTISSFTVADVVGTPHPEVLYQVSGSPGNLFIADRHASGTTQIIGLGSSTDTVRSWAIGDINQDGQKDVVAFSSGTLPTSGAVKIFTASGAGFTLTTIADPGAPSIHLVDVDGNGSLDLVSGPRVRFNNAGSFSAAVVLPSAAAANDVQPGDFDGDGDIDFACITRVVSNGTLLIQPIRNDGGQVFTPVATISISGDYFLADVGRMDGNLRDDLVLVYSASNRLRCRSMLGTAQGTLSVRPFFELYGNVGNVGDLDIDDLDGDGNADVVTSFLESYGYHSVGAVLMNTGSGEFVAGAGSGLSTVHVGGLGLFELIDEDLDGDSDIICGSTNGFYPIYALQTAYNVPPTVLGPTSITAHPSPTGTNMAPVGSVFYVRYDFELPNGTPARSQIATIAFTSAIGSTPNPKNVVTSSVGDVVFEFDFGPIPGEVSWTITTADGGLLADSWTSLPMLGIAAGNGQSFCVGTNLPQPLVVLVTDYLGQPVAGMPVTFGGDQNPPIVVPTDSAGHASLFAIPSTNVPGPRHINATIASGSSVDFNLNVMAPVIVATGGSNQVTTAGMFFEEPLSLTTISCGGAPIPPGTVVTFTPSNPLITLSASTATTDATGTASVTAFASNSASGNYVVTAAIAGLPIATFNLFARRLLSVVGPTSILFVYTHEHSNASLLLAADLPLPAPGAVSTAFGDIHTSILNPAPTLSVIDGLGIFGPVAPNMKTMNLGVWSRTVARPSTPLGMTFVVEIYGYDPSYTSLESYFVSNPVTVGI